MENIYFVAYRPYNVNSKPNYCTERVLQFIILRRQAIDGCLTSSFGSPHVPRCFEILTWHWQAGLQSL